MSIFHVPDRDERPECHRTEFRLNRATKQGTYLTCATVENAESLNQVTVTFADDCMTCGDQGNTYKMNASRKILQKIYPVFLFPSKFFTLALIKFENSWKTNKRKVQEG